MRIPVKKYLYRKTLSRHYTIWVFLRVPLRTVPFDVHVIKCALICLRMSWNRKEELHLTFSSIFFYFLIPPFPFPFMPTEYYSVSYWLYNWQLLNLLSLDPLFWALSCFFSPCACECYRDYSKFKDFLFNSCPNSSTLHSHVSF